jgi:quercetin dioxygenase-like cupin family protein
VLRGRGEVTLGSEVHPLSFGDTVYVAPHEVHQFRNTAADEPFGFLCIVDAKRDRPVIVGEKP